MSLPTSLAAIAIIYAGLALAVVAFDQFASDARKVDVVDWLRELIHNG